MAYKQAQHDFEEAKFIRCKTPTEEASVDIKRFLAEHFLDDTGQPAPGRTRVPIALPDFKDRMRLHEAAERIPGLHTLSGGQNEERILFIGWNRAEIRKQANDLEAQSRQKATEAAAAQWDTRMENHKRFVKAQGSKEGTATGEYIIECKAISEEWEPEDIGDMSLRIMSERAGGRLVGIFDFGVIAGIMRLTEKDQAPKQERVVSDHDDSDSEKPASELAARPSESTGSKRKANASSSAQPSSKKSRPTGQEPLHFNFQWRGRETGEGEIQLDCDGSNVGRLDFVDKSYAVLEGFIDIGFTGRVALKGYKTSSIAGPQTEDWDDYDSDAYEEEKFGRWYTIN